MDPRLMRHYEGELAYLRDMGVEFAAEFPKIAARLDIGTTEVADPAMERLLEGFAFLTARIQLKMGRSFRPSPSRCCRWSIRTTWRRRRR